MTAHFVISGTDTGVGKTVFSAALTGALQAHYWKPVQSGLLEETDSEIVARLSGIPRDRILPEAYRLKAPVSPHLSARLDHLKINEAALQPPAMNNPLIIEGAGGLLVPLTHKLLLADVIARWHIPIILCARTSLGTINHTLLSIEALRSRDVQLHGVVFIGDENNDTQSIITTIANVKMLGRMPFLDNLTRESVRDAFHANFDLASFMEGGA